MKHLMKELLKAHEKITEGLRSPDPKGTHKPLADACLRSRQLEKCLYAVGSHLREALRLCIDELPVDLDAIERELDQMIERLEKR